MANGDSSAKGEDEDDGGVNDSLGAPKQPLSSSSPLSSAASAAVEAEVLADLTNLASARPEMELLREVASLLAETCLTIASSSGGDGSTAIVALVLPHVEKFFAMFSHLYGDLLKSVPDATGRTMMMTAIPMLVERAKAVLPE